MIMSSMFLIWEGWKKKVKKKKNPRKECREAEKECLMVFGEGISWIRRWSLVIFWFSALLLLNSDFQALSSAASTLKINAAN